MHAAPHKRARPAPPMRYVQEHHLLNCQSHHNRSRPVTAYDSLRSGQRTTKPLVSATTSAPAHPHRRTRTTRCLVLHRRCPSGSAEYCSALPYAICGSCTPATASDISCERAAVTSPRCPRAQSEQATRRRRTPQVPLARVKGVPTPSPRQAPEAASARASACKHRALPTAKSQNAPSTAASRQERSRGSAYGTLCRRGHAGTEFVLTRWRRPLMAGFSASVGGGAVR
ncbi:hypothetical protein BV25DRAFT_1543669 [Artomyces pyxidatus]|uniref:Uncharacterized protein n=1 Tax=Artomyces pyxidatus TaxID=48021 RepID=A0ACB8SKQ0_9AGAM|nr:hypothetical protein BV25DRAFT_1543669 [Artomyces pyxidatus]